MPGRQGTPDRRRRPASGDLRHGRRVSGEARRQRFDYRHALLTDARGRPLIYVDNLAIIPSGHGGRSAGGSIGLAGATFAPGVFERVSRGIPTARVYSANRLRLTLHGLRLSFHAGEQTEPDGGRHVQAAVGTYRRLARV